MKKNHLTVGVFFSCRERRKGGRERGSCVESVQKSSFEGNSRSLCRYWNAYTLTSAKISTAPLDLRTSLLSVITGGRCFHPSTGYFYAWDTDRDSMAVSLGFLRGLWGAELKFERLRVDAVIYLENLRSRCLLLRFEAFSCTLKQKDWHFCCCWTVVVFLEIWCWTRRRVSTEICFCLGSQFLVIVTPVQPKANPHNCPVTTPVLLVCL